MRGMQLGASAAFALLVGAIAASSAAAPARPEHPARDVTGVAGKGDDDMPQCAKDWDKCMRPCFDRMSVCYGQCIKAGHGKSAIHECIVRCDKSKDKCEKDMRCVPC
jgi:hypothetical protein